MSYDEHDYPRADDTPDDDFCPSSRHADEQPEPPEPPECDFPVIPVLFLLLTWAIFLRKFGYL